MNSLSVPVAMATSVTAYVGLYHLWLFLKRKHLSDLYFSLTCICMTSYDAFSLKLYQGVPLVEAEFCQRVQFMSAVALVMPFILLVNDQVSLRTRPWGFAVLSFFPLSAIYAGYDPYDQLLTDTPLPKELSAPWGTASFNELALGPLWRSHEALLPLMILYCVWAGWGAIRFDKGVIKLRSQRSTPLVLGGTALLLSVLHDSFVAQGKLTNPYVLEFAWVGVSAVMSWILSKDILTATRTKETLEETERRVATTLMAIQDAVITTDMAGNITHLNPAAEKLLAINLWDTLDQPLNDYLEITSPETEKIVNDPIRFAVGRQADPYGRLPQLVTTDGNERHVDVGGAPLRNQQGHVEGAIVVLRDLTLQHNALESLQHANKMESMGQLAGGAAHDLNNLLTPIMSYVELVQRTLDKDSQPHKFLNHVQDAAQRAAGLTKQLLALSRKQVLDVQVVPLSEFVSQTIPMVERLVGEKVKLKVNVDSRAGMVRVDPGQLEQVILNLASNARDAMGDDAVLTIRTRQVNEREAALEVSDNGKGMSPSIVEKIFEPFFTTKPRGKGTGLGLASVRGIVEQHGGRIFVDSEPHEGSSFEIILPTTNSVQPESATRADLPTDMSRGDECILVAEDDPAVRSLIYDALTQLGYTVHLADGMTMAVSLAKTECVDMLLTDVVLPGADGPRIRDAVLAHRDVPCLFMTGHADDRLGERGFVPRGTEVLRKPFTVVQLAQRIRQVLDSVRGDSPHP